MEYLFGINYEKHSLYEYYKSKLHDVNNTIIKGGLDNLEITLPNIEQSRVEKFKVLELKSFFFRESLDKVFERVQIHLKLRSM